MPIDRPSTDRPSTDRPGTDRSKVLSVRLTADEFDRLSAQAEEVGVGASTLARTLIRRGLSPQAAGVNDAAAQPYSPLEQKLVSDLITRVETLERWVAGRQGSGADQ